MFTLKLLLTFSSCCSCCVLVSVLATEDVRKLVHAPCRWTATLLLNDFSEARWTFHMRCFCCSTQSCFLSTLTNCLLLPHSVWGRKSSEERCGQSICSHPLCSQYVCTASIQWPANEPACYTSASSTQRSWTPSSHEWLRSWIWWRQLGWATSIKSTLLLFQRPV